MFRGKIFLSLVLLLLLVNFVSGFSLELMYISLIISFRLSLTHLLGFQFQRLGSLNKVNSVLNKGEFAMPTLFSGTEVLTAASHKTKCCPKNFLITMILMTQVSLKPFSFLVLI